MMSNQTSNPYVGPRPFTKKEHEFFFGRKREASDLTSLVVAEPLLLFYAQSGAGKTSLINASLIPALEEKGFEVLPVGRVSGEWKSGTDEVHNIYVYNLLLSLVEIEREEDAHRFTSMTLAEFLDNVIKDGDHCYYDETVTPTELLPRALIIDQFEDILIAHPEAWGKREEFFRQLAEAIEVDPYLSVVLSMRADYVTELDPYLSLLPGKLKARFYMQRMREEAALDAVMNPLEKVGWTFEKKAAKGLVRDLRRIQSVPIREGEQVTPLDEFIEPVQLQVVCYQLWRSLDKTKEGKTIAERDLEELAGGNVTDFVDTSLARFYDQAVIAVAEDKPGCREFDIRNWFEQELITQSGTRNLVPVDLKTGKVGKLDLETVRKLDRDYLLVRRESRAGRGQWCELTHDRFIEPIRESNRQRRDKVREEHEAGLKRQTVLFAVLAFLGLCIGSIGFIAILGVLQASKNPDWPSQSCSQGRNVKDGELAWGNAITKATEIRIGERRVETLWPTGGGVWKFRGERDQAISIEMRSGPFLWLDPYLTLLGPDCIPLIEDDDSGGGLNGLNSRIVFVLPETGTYVVEARTFAGGGTGDYTLLLTEAITEGITLGESRPGEIEDGVIWTFEGQADQAVKITIDADGLDTFWTLEWPDGTTWTLERPDGTTFDMGQLPVVLWQNGTYAILPRGSDDAAPYELSLTEIQVSESDDPYLLRDLCFFGFKEGLVEGPFKPACQRAAELVAQSDDLDLLRDLCIVGLEAGLSKVQVESACQGLAQLTAQSDDLDLLRDLCIVGRDAGLSKDQVNSTCQRAIELAAQSDDPWLLSDICSSSRDAGLSKDQVNSTCQRAAELAVQSEDPWLLSDLCSSGLDMGLPEEDVQSVCQQALELAVESDDPYLLRDLCLSSGDQSTCQRAFELAAQSEDLDLLRNLCFSSGDQSTCQRAAELAARADDPFLLKDLCFYGLDMGLEEKDVRSVCQRMAELTAQSDDLNLLNELCYVGLDMGLEEKDVRSVCQQALELAVESDDLNLLNELCSVGLGMGLEGKNVRSVCQRAVELAAQSEDLNLASELCSVGLGMGLEEKNVRSVCQRAVELAAQSEDLDLLRDLCFSSGDQSTCQRAAELAARADDPFLLKDLCFYGLDMGLEEKDVRSVCQRMAELTAQSDDLNLLNELCYVGLDMGLEEKNVRSVCQRAVELAARSEDLWLLTDLCFSGRRDMELPQDVVQSACQGLAQLAVQSEDPWLLSDLCSLGLEAGLSKDQVNLTCQRAIELAARSEEPYLLSNLCSASLDRLACQRAIELAARSEDLDLLSDLCFSSLDAGLSKDRVNSTCQRAAELAAQSDDPWLLSDLCSSGLDMGLPEEDVQSTCQRAIELAAGSEDPWLLNDLCFSSLDRSACEQAIELAVEFDDLYLLSDLCSVGRDAGLTPEEVQPACQRAIELAVQLEDPYLLSDLCVSGLEAGLAEDTAMPACQRAIELESEDPILYNHRGFAYAELGKYERAVADYDKAIELDPDYENVDYTYNNRGFAYGSLGKYEQAFSDFERAIALNPDNAWVYYNRALIHIDMGQSTNAIPDLELSLQLENPPLDTKRRAKAEELLEQLQTWSSEP